MSKKGEQSNGLVIGIIVVIALAIMVYSKIVPQTMDVYAELTAIETDINQAIETLDSTDPEEDELLELLDEAELDFDSAFDDIVN